MNDIVVLRCHILFLRTVKVKKMLVMLKDDANLIFIITGTPFCFYY